MKVVWSDDALLDVARLRQFLSDKNPVAADAATKLLLSAGDDLGFMPLRFRSGSISGTRERVVGQYVMLFDVEPDTIRILRLWHGREKRQPDEAEASEEQPA